MWIFLTNAFLSVVVFRDDPAMFLVRARTKGDIERIFPFHDVEYTPEFDYPYRALVDKYTFADTIAQQAVSIDYDNFKGAVRDRDRHDKYFSVWSVMRRPTMPETPVWHDDDTEDIPFTRSLPLPL